MAKRVRTICNYNSSNTASIDDHHSSQMRNYYCPIDAISSDITDINNNAMDYVSNQDKSEFRSNYYISYNDCDDSVNCCPFKKVKREVSPVGITEIDEITWPNGNIGKGNRTNSTTSFNDSATGAASDHDNMSIDDYDGNAETGRSCAFISTANATLKAQESGERIHEHVNKCATNMDSYVCNTISNAFVANTCIYNYLNESNNIITIATSSNSSDSNNSKDISSSEYNELVYRANKALQYFHNINSDLSRLARHLLRKEYHKANSKEEFLQLVERNIMSLHNDDQKIQTAKKLIDWFNSQRYKFEELLVVINKINKKNHHIYNEIPITTRNVLRGLRNLLDRDVLLIDASILAEIEEVRVCYNSLCSLMNYYYRYMM